ncbi:MAG: hypothetical protein HY904_25130 [Deltaproteobacteria bacterium]|nr:hypothetical protein [Deltaproteobacteria bacterium]
MGTGKLDVTQLEALVAQGRHQEAMEGYQRLLATRPNDPLLRARVDMLREAAANADAFASAQDQLPPALRDRETDMKTTFVVTPEEVADSYVVAGRYDDALLLLEKSLQQRPQDKGLVERIEKVRRLRQVSADGGAGEVTTPQQTLPVSRPAPARAAPARAAAPVAPAFGAPRSSAGGPGAAARSAVPVAADRAATVVASERQLEALRTAAAAPTFGQPRSTPGGAGARRRSDSSSATPTLPADTAAPERTVRSPPPRVRPVSAQPLAEATVISPPPAREPTGDGNSDTSAEVASAHYDASELPDERTTPARSVVEDAEDATKTVLAPPPTGLVDALSTGDEISGGFQSSPRLGPVEPTQVSPPPEPTRTTLAKKK